MITRILATVATFLMWSWATFFMSSGSQIGLGYIAGHQFDNSDVAAIGIQGAIGLINNLPYVASFLAILVFITIWAGPFARLVKRIKELDEKTYIPVLLVAAIVFAPFGSAKAYYEQQNWPEIYYVQPNESAFWIPDVGANKDSQAKFGSEAYYNENKIAAKRFDIPHIQLPASSWLKNYFVPAGRLIIVDRTPVARIWVMGHDRGTSSVNQSLPCQSMEGLDVTTGISIGASVTEEDAPRFLYRFGTHAASIPDNLDADTKARLTFQSVYRGFSLSEVMDQRIHPEVQALVCDEFTKLPLDEVNKKLSTEIMPNIKKNVTQYLKGYGINLDFIGWADTNTFDPKVQEAINRLYIANKEAEIARALAPLTDTLQKLANAEATREMAAKWNGEMPKSLTVIGGDKAPGILGAILNQPAVTPPAK